jgi:hypothetical protein
MRPTPTACPVIDEALLPNASDLEPLLAFLQRDTLPTQPVQLERGTVFADGRLDLCKQNLGSSGAGVVLRALHHQTAIDAVLLGTNAIGDAGALEVAQLIRAAKLETVYLGCNAIRAAGVEHLASALETDTRVRALWLKRNPLGAAGIHRLARMLERNSTLRTLDIVNTSPDHDSLVDLLAVVATHPSLEHLYLSGNGIDTDEGDAVAGTLENPRLKGLYLSVNHLGDAGAERLAAALRRNRTLEQLGLASNGIGDVGVEAICNALETHPSLRTLDLGYSPSTRVLGAQRNEIGANSVPTLSRLLGTNQNLLEINLQPNAFSDAEKAALLEAARTVPHRTVRLGGREEPRANQRPHDDAARIRSVYR